MTTLPLSRLHARRPAVFAVITLAAVFLAAACRSTPQAAQPAVESVPGAFTGTVAESMNAGGYTYARLQAAGQDDVWVAATEFPVAVGERLTVTLDMPVANFESKTMNRTFPVVYFVSSVSRDGQAAPAATPQGAPPLLTSRDSATAPAAVDPIAPPPGGVSVADVWAKKSTLAGETVTVRGRVVKMNLGIMGRNWLHLQDGSGSAGDGTNDLTVTTDAEVTVGATITITGVLAVGKDFGAGYVYDAIVENAKIVKP